MDKKIIIAGVIGLAVGLVGGYFGGKAFTPQGNRNFTAGRTQMQNGQNRQFPQQQNGNGNGAGFASGEIQDISSDKLTLKTREGSSQIVLLNSSTTFKKLNDATQGDFQSGVSVTITGKSNPDGSITATNVQTAPENMGQRPQ